MSTFVEYYMEHCRKEAHEQGLEQGMEQATVNSIRSLMTTLGLTEQQAMDALLIPAESQMKYASMLS